MRKENKKSRNKGLKGKKRGGKRKHRKPGIREINKFYEKPIAFYSIAKVRNQAQRSKWQ